MKRGEILISVVALALMGLACVALGIRAYVPAQELQASFQEIFYTFSATTKAVVIFVGMALGIGAGVSLVWLAWVAYHSGVIWKSEAEIKKAAAYQARRDASLSITVLPAGSQAIISELLDAGTHFRHVPGHLLAATFNGEYKPSAADLSQWAYYHGSHSPHRQPDQIQAGGNPQLAAPELPALPVEVHLKEYVYQPSLGAIFLGIGRLPGEFNPRPIVAPLERLVHIATAGSSGFGKSTFMQALAYQALNAPESRPLLMDAQGVTFSAFEGHPALLTRLASEEADIINALDLLLDECERRKGLYSQIPGCAKLRDYNSRADEPLPAIPAFFDEFGLLSDNKDVVAKVKLLSQGGRKWGIYLVLGSQTWLASQFTTALRSNLSTSIQFSARDKNQSRVLLSAPDAAKITLPGRAYAILPGQAGLVELQAPMVEEEELKVPGQVMALPDPASARALALKEAGASLSAIAKEIFRLDREPNGRDIKRVKMLLGEHD
jgi:DNA segregation ATPase FtsK/SpoIIIE-like protein